MHTTTGGGLTYLAGILPELAKDERFEWLLLAPRPTLAKLAVPVGVAVEVAPELGFWRGHAWEQLVLPWKCLRWGVKAVLCNANYVPLLAPKPMPVVHTTPRAAGQAVGWRMKVYWRVLRSLTTLSLWRAPVAFSVARPMVYDYVGPRTAAKVRIAPSAVQNVPEETAKDPNLVVTVGDFYPQKDYPLLLEAFRIARLQRPGTRLVIIGRAVDAGVRDHVLRLVRELKLADGVTLTGAMPHVQLMKTVAKASVYVSTSKAESFNIPVLEAMACGVPCVLPDVDFQREVAGEAAVYVPVRARQEMVDALAMALVGVLESGDVQELLGKAGKARAALFTWAATAAVIRTALY